MNRLPSLALNVLWVALIFCSALDKRTHKQRRPRRRHTIRRRSPRHHRPKRTLRIRTTKRTIYSLQSLLPRCRRE